MKSQEELSAEIQRLLNADRLEEAEVLIEQLEPISPEELRRRLDEAPWDDEPLTPKQLRRIEKVEAMIAEMKESARSERPTG
jgi:hypothetical protein